jgi:hypothetical protein
MSRKGHDDTKDTAPEERIGRMKQQLEEVSGGDLFAWESDALTPEHREAFWRHIIEGLCRLRIIGTRGSTVRPRSASPEASRKPAVTRAWLHPRDRVLVDRHPIPLIEETRSMCRGAHQLALSENHWMWLCTQLSEPGKPCAEMQFSPKVAPLIGAALAGAVHRGLLADNVR